MKSSALLAAALAAGLLLGGCGSGDPERLINEGYTALDSGRYGEALALFDRALDGLEPAHAQYARAHLGAIDALAMRDGEEAGRRFLQLVESHSEIVGWKQHWSVGERLRREGDFQPAIAVLTSGVDRFPDEERLKEAISKVHAALQRLDEPGNGDAQRMLRELEALGYLGDVDGE